MPHRRQRHIAPLLVKSLTYSPIVGLLGQRQTGKTTLCSELGKDYETLDLASNLSAAENDPSGFLKGRRPPFVIDECQMSPALFPALKESVRKDTKPGQFLLTGSVRFSSRKAIRESLTGRIALLELRPMTLREQQSDKAATWLPRFLKAKDRQQELRCFDAPAWARESTLQDYMETGGLPGICFFREAHIRATKFDDHLSTILDRDLRLLSQTDLPLSTLLTLVRHLAQIQGEAFELTKISQKTRISAPALRRLLPVLEGIFFLRFHETEGGMKKPVLFLEDQGLASHLGAKDPLTAPLRALYANIAPTLALDPTMLGRIFQYRTRGGAFIPLAIDTTLGVVGIIPITESMATPNALGSAQSFRKAYPEAKVIIAHCGEEKGSIAPGLVAVPVNTLL